MHTPDAPNTITLVPFFNTNLNPKQATPINDKVKEQQHKMKQLASNELCSQAIDQ